MRRACGKRRRSRGGSRWPLRGTTRAGGPGVGGGGLGWPYAPGLWKAAQVEGWKPVTDAVHQAGGRIVAQLWHMGRLVHPSLGGGQPVSASATIAPDFAHTYQGKKPYTLAREATR